MSARSFDVTGRSFVRLCVVVVGLRLMVAPAACGEAQTYRVVPVVAPHVMVVSGHPEATAVGLETLRAGGNAMDAAAAISLSLGVVEPYGSGLGGRLALLYYDAGKKEVTAVQAFEAASYSLDVEAVRRQPQKAHQIGGSAACVPGLPAGLFAAHQRWGRMKWIQVVRPAIHLAKEGFQVLPPALNFFRAQEQKLRQHAELGRIYLPEGRFPQPGSTLTSPDLAATLEQFARQGPDAIYRGAIAAAIIRTVTKGGGIMTMEDLARYQPVIGAPCDFEFGGYRVFTSAPPGTGGPILQLAVMATPTGGWPADTLRDPANLDLFGRIVRALYPIVQREIGDTSDALARYRWVTSPEGIGRVRAQAEADRGRPLAVAPSSRDEIAASSTTHFVVADAQGNIVTATQSTGNHFGCGEVAEGTGIVLNDWMNSLTYAEPESPNFVAPGKRGRSTTTPTLVFQEQRPVVALGVPGGQRIPIAVAQVLLDYIVFKRPLEKAIGDTRFHIVRPTTSSELRNLFTFEPTVPPATLTALRKLGWDARVMENVEYFGGFTAIEFTADGLRGLADPRRTNVAAGF